MLVSNGRLEVTPQVRVLFEALKREHEGVLEAHIISALPIGDAEVKPLVAELEAKYKRKVTVKVDTDPSLIGGVKIVVGDKVIDATVRGKLDTMANSTLPKSANSSKAGSKIWRAIPRHVPKARSFP
jgi:F-type H+-transporting ATPase subunit delta